MPGYSGDSWIETNSTLGSSRKISFVPLPWWTSQSRISTRSTPCARRRVARRDRRVAEEAEAHRAVGLGVVAGRAQRREARRAPRPTSSASTSATAAARRAQRRLVGRRRRRPCPCRRARRRARSARRCSGCGAPGGRRAARPASPRAPRRSSQPNQSWRSIAASSATIRSRPLGMAGDVVGERELVAQPDGPGHPDTVGLSVERADLIVVGAGAAGLYASPDRRPRGRARHARSPPARSPRPRPTGRRAGSPPRSPPTTRRSSTSRTRSTPGRGIVRRSAARVLCARGARALPRPRVARRALRRRPPRQPRARPRGRALAPPRRARGRQRDRPPDPARALGRRRRASRASRCSRAARGRAAARPERPLRRPRHRRRPRRSRRARSCSPPAAPPRCGRARPTRRARSAPACCWRARPARRSPTSSSSSSTPPRSPAIPGREGFLVSEAVRGEGATLHDADGERFVDELAPRDHVARAIRTVMDRRGDAVRLPRHAPRRPRPLPQRRRGAARGRPRPDARARPGRARRALRHGRDRHRPRGPHRASAGLYAVGECACTGLHGANRLASNSLSECFVFGYRAALRRARRARRRARPSAPAPADVAAARARDPRGGLARRRPRARRRRACGGCSRTRTRSPGSSPRSALAREESRGAHLRADYLGDRSGAGRVPLRHRRAAAARSLMRSGTDTTSVLMRTQHSARSELNRASAICRIRGCPPGRAGRVGRADDHVPTQPLHLPRAGAGDPRGPRRRRRGVEPRAGAARL